MRFLPIAALALAARAAAPAAAADAPRDTTVYAAPPVAVKAARPRATPGGATALELGLDSARTRPAPTLEQALRGLPLVVLRANSRGEVQPALRGGEDRQIAVLVDGVPITLAWDHRTDLSIVPVTAARSLTLHRGFTSLLMGPNALAGAVEVAIARGAGADLAPPPLQLEAGVDHRGGRSAAAGAGRLIERADGGRWVMRAGGGHRASDGVALPGGLAQTDPATRARLTADGERRLNTDLESWDGYLSLRRVFASGAWASLSGAGYRGARGVAPEAHTTQPRLWRYPFQARGFGALAAGTGFHDTRFGRGDLELSVGADLGRTEIAEYAALDYRDVTGREQDDDRTLTARLLGDHTVGGAGDLRLAATFAEVFHRERIDDDPAARYRQRLWSLAAETGWRLGAGVPLRVSAGAAADGADTPESADKPALGRRWDWAGRVGATATLSPALQAHAAAGRRARFPALRELYSGALGRFLANPGLRPEAQRSIEAGFTARLGAGAVQLAGFAQELDDAIARITVATPSGNRFQRVNLGGVTARGVEVVARWDAGALAWGGDLTLQRTRGADAAGAATPLEYEPALQGGAWIETPLPFSLRLGAELRGAGAQRHRDLDSGEWRTLAPGARVDLRLARGFTLGGAALRRLDAALAVENAADQAVFDQAGLPQPGRTLRVMARLW